MKPQDTYSPLRTNIIPNPLRTSVLRMCFLLNGENSAQSNMQTYSFQYFNFCASAQKQWKMFTIFVISVRLSLSIYPSSPRGIPWTDFRELLYWERLWKSVQEIKICLKSYKNISHFTWKPTQVYIVDSSTKYLEARQQCKENQY